MFSQPFWSNSIRLAVFVPMDEADDLLKLLLQREPPPMDHEFRWVHGNPVQKSFSEAAYDVGEGREYTFICVGGKWQWQWSEDQRQWVYVYNQHQLHFQWVLNDHLQIIIEHSDRVLEY